MFWMIILFTVFICFSLMIWRAAKGPVHSLATLEVPIRDLLRRGYKEGFLVINIHYTKQFVQLKKYIHNKGNYGMEFCFPNTKWSDKLFVKLVEFCTETEIDFVIGEEHAKEPLEFLYIDFGKDVLLAHSTIVDILLNVFGVDDDVKLFVRLENASVKDELIEA